MPSPPRWVLRTSLAKRKQTPISAEKRRTEKGQIPFIHSAQLIVSSRFYVYVTVFKIFPPFGTFKCVLVRCKFEDCACALKDTLISRFRVIIKALFCSIRYVQVTYWHKIDGNHACAFAEQMIFYYIAQPNKSVLIFSLCFVFLFLFFLKKRFLFAISSSLFP